MSETMNTILNRRSTRAFKPEQIKEEELNLILEAAKFAPSAMNEQPWHFTVIQNKELLNKINEVCRNGMLRSGNKQLEERAKAENFSIFYNAPTYIIVSGQEKAIAPQIDCALSIQNMFLSAESQGIGSCWIHAVTQLFSSEEGRALRKELDIPEGFNIYGSGAFGYKAVSAAAAPRKENLVKIIR